jgi:hypothetical protein
LGYGDEIMATGMARGAKSRGKRIAFGDGQRIIYSPWSEMIFRGNPNIARPGQEGASDLEWIAHHKGNRLYNSISPDKRRWIWNLRFRPTPGEMFFTEDELRFAAGLAPGFVLVEPNVPWKKTCAPNKDWGATRYARVALELQKQGHRIVQFGYAGASHRLTYAKHVMPPTFRHALAVLARAALYIGPEGGLHHGAAAVGIPAVVLFGGFIPPQVTGYDTHTNLTGGAIACGKLKRCDHCINAMNGISVDQVVTHAVEHLNKATVRSAESAMVTA